MKLIMVLGGLLGFGIGFGFRWASGSPWPSVLWRSVLAALLAGRLLRWWGRVWLKSLQQAVKERQDRSLQEASNNPPPSKPSRK